MNADEQGERIVPIAYDHDKRDPMDQVIRSCMICGSNTLDNRKLSQYNKTTTVCLSCGQLESALLVTNRDALKSPKPLWSKWIVMIRDLSQKISRHAKISYVRHGHDIFPIPNRQQIIDWLGDQANNDRPREMDIGVIRRWERRIRIEDDFTDSMMK